VRTRDDDAVGQANCEGLGVRQDACGHEGRGREAVAGLHEHRDALAARTPRRALRGTEAGACLPMKQRAGCNLAARYSADGMAEARMCASGKCRSLGCAVADGAEDDEWLASESRGLLGSSRLELRGRR